MNGFTPKLIGHIDSVRKIKVGDFTYMNGEVHNAGYDKKEWAGQHLYLESDVQMLWNQLQAARETIVQQNKAIESLLTVKKLFEVE